jgi:hypothetical protein
MSGRKIHLQHEVTPDRWEDLATTEMPEDASAPFAVATIRLPARQTLAKLRIVNLLDVFEAEVY